MLIRVLLLLVNAEGAEEWRRIVSGWWPFIKYRQEAEYLVEYSMHKSKLAGFIIDCNTEDLQGAAEFWGSALGMKTKQFSGEEGEKYVRLMDSSSDLHIEVQSVNHQSRIHLDIETDNIEAEVA
ncbi:MAG: hypothetical protein COA96_11910, partial [SAR86 cluster bacterium]